MASKKPAFANQPVIGVIGLGIMGGMMAETLLKAGYTVCGHDPAPAARGRLKRAGGASMISSTAVAGQADVIIVSLATSAALAQVAAQISAAPQRSGARTIVVETSTLPLDDKLAAAARLKRAGHTVLDCPISGTAALMHQRTWTIYVSGAP